MPPLPKKVPVLTKKYVVCPDFGCSQLAVVDWVSSNGTAKIRCVMNHWFMAPLETLEKA